MHVNKITSITPHTSTREEFDETEARKAALAVIADQIGGKVFKGTLVSTKSLKNTTFKLPEINCRVTFG